MHAVFHLLNHLFKKVLLNTFSTYDVFGGYHGEKKKKECPSILIELSLLDYRAMNENKNMKNRSSEKRENAEGHDAESLNQKIKLFQRDKGNKNT